MIDKYISKSLFYIILSVCLCVNVSIEYIKYTLCIRYQQVYVL